MARLDPCGPRFSEFSIYYGRFFGYFVGPQARSRRKPARAYAPGVMAHGDHIRTWVDYFHRPLYAHAGGFSRHGSAPTHRDLLFLLLVALLKHFAIDSDSNRGDDSRRLLADHDL